MYPSLQPSKEKERSFKHSHPMPQPDYSSSPCDLSPKQGYLPLKFIPQMPWSLCSLLGQQEEGRGHIEENSLVFVPSTLSFTVYPPCVWHYVRHSVEMNTPIYNHLCLCASCSCTTSEVETFWLFCLALCPPHQFVFVQARVCTCLSILEAFGVFYQATLRKK